MPGAGESSGVILEAVYHKEYGPPSSKTQSWKGLEHHNGSMDTNLPPQP